MSEPRTKRCVFARVREGPRMSLKVPQSVVVVV